MFFLLRAAFWLFLVSLFLPVDGSTGGNARAVAQTEPAPSAESSAPEAGFCDRQPALCAAGDTAMTTLRETAEIGVTWLTGLVVEHVVGELAGFRRNASDGGMDTLTSEDREPAWRGPAA